MVLGSMEMEPRALCKLTTHSFMSCIYHPKPLFFVMYQVLGILLQP
jgi:hypothetical protein